MHIYRFIKRESGLTTGPKGKLVEYTAPATSSYRGLVVIGPCFVSTDEELDIDELYEKHHVAAKEVEAAPEGVELIDLSKNTRPTSNHGRA